MYEQLSLPFFRAAAAEELGKFSLARGFFVVVTASLLLWAGIPLLVLSLL